MTSQQDRSRLARALAEFWRGGAGPTHDDLTRSLEGPNYTRIYRAES